ncbi:MAG: 50S ribosomal protein L33 [Bacilli bacterium]|nr:50S ribosomal protein L33 [Bacilli bacterium]
MAKKNENRIDIELKCTKCGFIIRPTEKNKANNPDKMEIKKFCKTCNKKQVFKEKK